MRVKIGNHWYSSEEEPICIQVSIVEQEQIANIDRKIATAGKYAVYDKYIDPDELLNWMLEDVKDS